MGRICMMCASLGVLMACQTTGTNDLTLSSYGHPRILLLEGEEEQIHRLIESDKTWARIHRAVIRAADEIVVLEPLHRVMVGRRLLGTSRELLRRVFYLSYAYRMSGELKYLKKAEEEMLSVSEFKDWNPTHFLDVAEMTMGVAIGYDWLYSDLTEDSRETIRNAIVEKGLEPSNNRIYTWWLNSTNNWNQVCNAGMTFGALAVQEDYPELARQIISRAFRTIPKAMGEYKPDGVYPEGYGYWGYGTSFNVMFLSAVEKALGSDSRLSRTPGFLDTGEFLNHMITPTGKSFNWSDCGSSTNLNTAMFWIAGRAGDSSMLWSQRMFLRQVRLSAFQKIRNLPALLVWAKDIQQSEIEAPDDKFWTGQGPNPVAMMRTSWTELGAMYVGFKAGSPSVNHGHMDVGSFIMESEGVRWAVDLGMQNYESLESKGMSIFGKDQNAQRWTVFRMNTFSHNVLIVDNEQQRVNGYAKIDRFSDREDFMYAISDLSEVYNGQLKKAVRGIGIRDGKYTVVRDEIETQGRPTTVRWNMVTGSRVILDERSAILESGANTLILKVETEEEIEMNTWSTSPTNDYDAENPGTVRVGFECNLAPNSSVSFEVHLVPQSAQIAPPREVGPLDKW